MKLLTKDDFDALEAVDPYYKGRWSYYEVALRWVRLVSPERVLEIGPNNHPLVADADTMDIHGTPTFLHDACTQPWPVEDKSYDLVVALQVWEHLNGCQASAFREVMRVSRATIISVPYWWNCPGNIHHGIDDEKIKAWTCNVDPERMAMRGPSTRRRRIMLWRFPA